MAESAEADGFDGIGFGDTQNLAADPYIGLALAARVTSRLLLGVRVATPATRHPTAAANSIATVHLESGGRAVLGVGRGDSSATASGVGPMPLRGYLETVQECLAGPRQLWWLPSDLPKVPVDVAATGPRTIALGARLADAVTVTVGAEPSRVSSAVAMARPASVGAYVNVVAHPSLDVARQLVRGPAAAYAHFSGMGPSAPGAHPDDLPVFASLAANYDRRRHGRSDASHIRFLDDAFVDRFAVAGPPAYCVDRLAALADCGLDRIVVVGPARDGDPEERKLAVELFAKEVLPGLRDRLA
jgi:5,10-methylenetetrahydromethanopterin reductase